MFPRILVVEDDRPIRTLLIAALRRAGLEAEGAGDGAEALELLAVRPFVLMLIDLMMPRMDGFALIEELSRIGEKRPMVIVMTAFPDVTVHRLDPQVVHAFVRKPFDLETIVETIREMAGELALEGSGNEAVGEPPEPPRPTEVC